MFTTVGRFGTYSPSSGVFTEKLLTAHSEFLKYLFRTCELFLKILKVDYNVYRNIKCHFRQF